jgi:hypothetical protein
MEIVNQPNPESRAFAPCRLVPHEDGSYSLCFDAFEATQAIFEEMGWDGGGYSWHGVVDALVQLKAPDLQEKLDYDPEASMFVALSEDQEALAQVAGLIREAIDDPTILREAIENADPDLMD